MPTIQQLPPAQTVGPADELPLSQAGALCSVTVGTLLASTQPAILAPTGSLLGRLSLGAGGPEPVSVGPGLAIQDGTIAATGADHASFPVEATPSAADQVILTTANGSRLLALSSLQEWLGASPGSQSTNFANLPVSSTIGAGDLVAISQNGTNAAISYANLLNGETIDEAAPASATSDSDTFWVA
jgi:hypothetical protein